MKAKPVSDREYRKTEAEDFCGYAEQLRQREKTQEENVSFPVKANDSDCEDQDENKSGSSRF